MATEKGGKEEKETNKPLKHWVVLVVANKVNSIDSVLANVKREYKVHITALGIVF